MLYFALIFNFVDEFLPLNIFHWFIPGYRMKMAFSKINKNNLLLIYDKYTKKIC